MYNYKQKYLKYKSKYLKSKSVRYSIGLKKLRIPEKIIMKCEEACNDSEFSKTFTEINNNYKELLKINKNKTFMDLYINLFAKRGTSYSYYSSIINNPNNFLNGKKRVITIDEFHKFLRKIKQIKRFCILIGTSENLAPIGMRVKELIDSKIREKRIKNKDEKYSLIKKTIKEFQFILSSMFDEVWNPVNNQLIIVDTLFDKPDVLKNYWQIVNGALVFITHKRIDDGEKLQLDNALDILNCRVTHYEICLIYKIINNNEFICKMYQINEYFYAYFIYKK